MVSGVYGYSGQDIYRQQAQKRAAEWAQRSTAQLQAAQGQRAGQVQYAQQPQQGYVQYAQPTQQVQQPEGEMSDVFSLDKKYGSTDGKDDGKIGFWAKVGHAIKGVGKTLAGIAGFEWNADGTYKGWNPKTALKTAGFVALTALTWGTAVPALMTAYGIYKTGSGLIKAGINAYNATTDAEAKAAWEDIGGNTFGLTASVTGLKTSMKAYNPSGNYSGIKGTGRALKDVAKLEWDVMKDGVKTLRDGWNNGKIEGMWEATKNSKFGQKVGANWNKYTKSTKVADTTKQLQESQNAKVKSLDDQIKRLEEKAGKATGDTKTQYEARANELKAQRTQIQDSYTEINSVKSFEEAQTKIQQAETNLADLKRQLADVSDDAAKTATLKKQITNAERQLEVYNEVTNAKLQQARAIDTKLKQYEKEFNDKGTSETRMDELIKLDEKLRTERDALDFKLPNETREYYKAQAEASSKVKTEAQEAYNTAKTELKNAQKAAGKFKEGDTSAEAVAARNNLETAKNNVAQAKRAYDNATIQRKSDIAYRKASSDYSLSETAKDYTTRFITEMNKNGEATWYSGRKIPFTQYTLPRVSGAWRIPANGIGIPGTDIGITANGQVGRVTSDELLMQQYAQLVGVPQEVGGQVPYQAQYTTPQFGQYTTGQAPFGMNLQNLDYQMKSLNLI